MIIFTLALFGLACGSFVNALVWRIYQQSKAKKQSSKYSISKGRSMCVNCKHQLAAKDLVPILSWLSLGGKCRYCKKPISRQYPIVEATTAGLFIVSYIFWPNPFNAMEWVIFGLWLVCLTGLVALVVYDIKWMILPNRIVFFLYIIGLLIFFARLAQTPDSSIVYDTFWAVLIGGGLFYLLFQLSKGQWIGGGDVKLGFLLGLLAGTASQALLLLFLASVIGCLYILPMMLAKKVTKKSRIPFGPFLIMATIIVVLFGARIMDFYTDNLLYY